MNGVGYHLLMFALLDSFEPSRCFAAMPLEATNRLLFCHWDIDPMDVVCALKPDYEAGVPKHVENQHKVLSKNGLHGAVETQGILVDLLCSSNQKFLQDFVWFATGHMYLPQRKFTITVEFNSREERFKSEFALPAAHSCDMIVKFPAKAYDASQEVLKQKLTLSIEDSLVTKFTMK
jgi:HECT-domain (ubiquitin-transferase)